MTRVAFLSCHLSGTGHLVRTLALARAVAAAGGEALVITGGRPVAHIDAGQVATVQLPPLFVEDFDFRHPRMPEGAVADAAYLARRERGIAEAVAGFAPHALVTETFPLGRRRQRSEFEAAIEAAGARAALVASVRDVPEPPSRPERLDEAAARLGALYDRLLVHGEADFLPLGESWPLPRELDAMIRHTGYVGGSAPEAGARGDEVLVSVGGGALGRRLIATALDAAGRSARPWRLLVGGADAREAAARLAERAPRNATVEPARPDYRTLLARAAVSVSLAGYNTVTDLAACTTPAILVPFEHHGQREQRIRADRLAAFEGVTVFSERALSAETLARAAERAADIARRPPFPLALDGAERAAAEIIALARAREPAA